MTDEQALMASVKEDALSVMTVAVLPYADTSRLVAQCAAHYIEAQPFGRNSMVLEHAEANLRWDVELWAARGKR